MINPTCTWGDWEFLIYPFCTQFANIPGVYIFVKIANGYYRAVFIGQSKNVGKKISRHYDDRNIVNYSDQVHVMALKKKSDRKMIKEKLIGLYEPMLRPTENSHFPYLSTEFNGNWYNSRL